MNIKFVLIGTVAWFLISQVIGMVSGMLIHGPGGALNATYMEFAAMWRPELNQQPPDMAALLPLWMSMAALNALLMAVIYELIRPALNAGLVANGVRFALVTGLTMTALYAMHFGLFALPARVWIFWGIEGALNYLLGGIALAFIAGRFMRG